MHIYLVLHNEQNNTIRRAFPYIDSNGNNVVYFSVVDSYGFSSKEIRAKAGTTVTVMVDNISNPSAGTTMTAGQYDASGRILRLP